ncbi:MAG: L-serine ammonia-lyase, iron-sulfur-dependent subunit beta [Thermaerobacter sp.]|nr:L-serine ammonia-lyase, iron-sulfur-dependent subunit beta [Thermaerobacter sp.]
MKYTSAFDIIGPVMVGPSSSHTAGANRIGRVARKLLGTHPERAACRFMGSFAETYRGHGTDLAVVAGICGMSAADPNIPMAFDVAREAGVEVSIATEAVGLYHPNTVSIALSAGFEAVALIGSSLGGGKIEIVEIDGFPVRLSGDRIGLVIWHTDSPGFAASVLRLAAESATNVARLTVERARRGGHALSAMEFDGPVRVPLIDGMHRLLAETVRYRWIDVV